MFKLWGLDPESSEEVAYLNVNLIWWSPVSIQDEMSGGEFFSCEIYVQGSSPWRLAAIWVVRRIGGGPFQGESTSGFVLSDSKLEGREKIENISLEIYSQIFFFGNESSGSNPVYRYVTRPQRQLTELESNIDKGANIIFSLQLSPFFFQG